MPLKKSGTAQPYSKSKFCTGQKLERSATEEELAEELNRKPGEISYSMCMSRQMVSLDTPLTEDGEENMLDKLEKNSNSADEKVNYTSSLKTEIDRSL